MTRGKKTWAGSIDRRCFLQWTLPRVPIATICFSGHYSKEVEERARHNRKWERQIIFDNLSGINQCISCFTSVSFNILNVILLKCIWSCIYNWSLCRVSYLRYWCRSSDKLSSLAQFCLIASNGSKIYTEVCVFLNYATLCLNPVFLIFTSIYIQDLECSYCTLTVWQVWAWVLFLSKTEAEFSLTYISLLHIFAR